MGSLRQAIDTESYTVNAATEANVNQLQQALNRIWAELDVILRQDALQRQLQPHQQIQSTYRGIP